MPQQRGEERREQILAEADRLFRGQGYAATSMRQIAEEAGFGRAVSGLYNHFPNKESIFAALLESRSPYGDLLAALEGAQGDTLQSYLRNCLGAMWTTMQPRLDFLQLVFIDFQEFEGRTLATFVGQVIPGFVLLFSQTMTFPEMRRDLPMTVLIRSFAAVMIGAMMTELMVHHISMTEWPFIPALGEAWLDGLASILARGLSVSQSEEG